MLQRSSALPESKTERTLGFFAASPSASAVVVTPVGSWDTAPTISSSHLSGVGVVLVQLTLTHLSFLLNHTAPQIGRAQDDSGFRFTIASTSVVDSSLCSPQLLHPRILRASGGVTIASFQSGRCRPFDTPHADVRKATRRSHIG